MNNKLSRFWPVWPVTIVLILLMAIMTLFTLIVDNTNKLLFIHMTLTVFAAGVVLLVGDRVRADTGDFMRRLAGMLPPSQSNKLNTFPSPTVMVGYRGEIIWYTDSFLQDVLNDVDAAGMNITRVCSGFDLEAMRSGEDFQIFWNDRWFGCSSSMCKGEDSGRYLVSFADITELKHTEAKYIASRPTVMLIVFDNEDELLRARESERMRIISAVDAAINDWVGVTEGICWADARDKSLIVLEEEAASRLIDGKFDILEKAKQIVAEDGTPVTLSIGVGRGGESIEQCEMWAIRALDMALGRGGDQAAMLTPDGYSFFGGTSNASERQSKVQIRMHAGTFSDLVKSADNVIVVGHRFSDLDSVGAALGVSAIVKAMDKEVFVCVDRQGSLANTLIDYYIKVTGADYIIDPPTALDRMREGTLLVVVDTNSTGIIDCRELYDRAESVVVIDHHRMVVDHIPNAKLLIHEPCASSTCEIVSEIADYISEKSITRPAANALLSGIMLDTKNFVLRTGVRTFEASAFLRRRGADTVDVKHMFSEPLDTYIAKSRLVSSADFYRSCAITHTQDSIKNARIVSSQAADDLLTIEGVSASFVLYEDNDVINISARSLGKVNVQLIMEAMGGGGHLTMAGAQLRGTSMLDALEQLHKEIEKIRQ